MRLLKLKFFEMELREKGKQQPSAVSIRKAIKYRRVNVEMDRNNC